MKKMTKATIACLASCMALFFYSCDEKSADELNPDYADLTVEQNKTNLENQGIAILQQMDAMKGMEWVEPIQSLMGIITGQSQQVYSEVNSLLAPLAKGDKNIMALTELRGANIESLSDVFDNWGGVYTYNAVEDTFAYAKSTTQLTLKFPIGDSRTNNGTITIDNYSYKVSDNVRYEGQELLKTLNISIKNGANTLMSVVMSASYNNEDVPETESTVITFKEGYSISQSANYNPEAFSWNFYMAYNDNKFFQGGLNMDGTLDMESIYETESEQDFMDNLLHCADAYVQIGNIKAVGKVTYAQLLKDEGDFEEKYPSFNPDRPTQSQVEEMCAIMNNNIKANLIYADSKEAIAKMAFYKVTEREGGNTYYYMGNKATFADGSAMDDSFFDTGFDRLGTAVETFRQEMLESYGIDTREDEYNDNPIQ